MHTIDIYRNRTGWIADFANATCRDEVERALGTTEVPTPFTPAAPVAKVIAALEKRNPGNIVLVRA